MHFPSCLAPFPADLADSLLEQALHGLKFTKERLDNLSDEDCKLLDDAVWRLVTAADVSDSPCHD